MGHWSNADGDAKGNLFANQKGGQTLVYTPSQNEQHKKLPDFIGKLY